MHLVPLSVVYLAPVLAVEPPDMAAGREARRVYGEVCLYGLQGKLLVVIRLVRISVSSCLVM
jgi:hypothetical protein